MIKTIHCGASSRAAPARITHRTMSNGTIDPTIPFETMYPCMMPGGTAKGVLPLCSF